MRPQLRSFAISNTIGCGKFKYRNDGIRNIDMGLSVWSYCSFKLIYHKFELYKGLVFFFFAEAWKSLERELRLIYTYNKTMNIEEMKKQGRYSPEPSKMAWQAEGYSGRTKYLHLCLYRQAS